LRDNKAREILHKLLATADIFPGKFPPPTRRSWASTYESWRS
jgi:crotonobetainyl-CoA:carnitine CoA-transferase CaiB-like acyl-CoA transferase